MTETARADSPDPTPVLAPGTVVAINTETGEVMTAATEDAVLALFEQRFGWGVPASLRIIAAPEAAASSPATRASS